MKEKILKVLNNKWFNRALGFIHVCLIYWFWRSSSEFILRENYVAEPFTTSEQFFIFWTFAYFAIVFLIAWLDSCSYCSFLRKYIKAIQNEIEVKAHE